MGNMIAIGEVVLGYYVVDDYIGLGGQANVMRGHDRRTGAKVAIKQLFACPGDPHYEAAKERLLVEGRLRINSPYVCHATEVGEQGGEYYIVMPYVEGVDLAQHLAGQGGRLPTEQAMSVIFQLAEGLQACHNVGVVHRDLKPQNIRIGTDGTVRILDFGICHQAGVQTLTQAGTALGTPAYMSPEQTVDPRAVDHRSDLYSLGAVFYETLTGLTTARGQTPEEQMRSVREDVPPAPHEVNPRVPAHVSHICLQLLSKRPEDRFQTAGELVNAMRGQPLPPQGIRCCSCGMPLDQGAAFCGFCGAPRHAQPQDARCLACGTSVGEAASCSGCGRPFNQSDHRLTFTGGTLAGQTFRVPEADFLTGRDQLSPRDFQISRKHLWVRCLNGSVSVQDAGSVNKTYCAGRLADSPTTLSPNQELYLAGNVATYTHK